VNMPESGADPARPRAIAPAPPVKSSLALRMGFSRAEYEMADGWFRTLWKTHLQAGLPGAPSRPDEENRRTFLRLAAGNATKALATGATNQLQPCLGRADEALGVAERQVEELDRWSGRDFDCAGEIVTVGTARQITDELNAVIQEDTNNGHYHHARVARWWSHASSALLFLDLVAIVVILADLFNIDYTHPIATPAQTSTVVALPLILILGQFWCAVRAGQGLNEHRELVHKDDAPDRLPVRVVLWLAAAALLACATTALLVTRLLTMSRDADLNTLWQVVLLLLGIVIGLSAPLVKVYVVAYDGSTVSRRRDLFAAELERQREAFEATLAEARAALADASSAHEDYVGRARPGVVRAARDWLAETENALGLLNVMLGAAGGGPAPAAEPAAGTADTGLGLAPVEWRYDGAPPIDNQPLLDRDTIYTGQLARAVALRDRLLSGPLVPAVAPPAAPAPAPSLAGGPTAPPVPTRALPAKATGSAQG
jgi:hypothetical protein